MEKERPDLIVLDILLPDMSGFDVCRAVRKHDDIPIVILSCKDGADEMIFGFELGADDYITKPFDPQVLVMRIKTRLRRFRDIEEGGDQGKALVPTEGDAGALSNRETEILVLIERGMTNENIARELNLSLSTVKWFNTQIDNKLNVKNRT